MRKVILEEGSPPEPLWIDLFDPSPAELVDLAERYKLHPALVQDCMQANHLPKHEQYGDRTFVIIRHYDAHCDLRQDSVQSMTRKLAIFLGDRFLISIHRSEQPFIEAVAEKYRGSPHPVYLQVVLLELLMAAAETYHRPLEEMEDRIHQFESSILKNTPEGASWEEIFRVKCRLTVIKRILWHTLNTVQKFIPFSSANMPLRQDLRERIESLLYFADELLDDLNSLLNIQLSLATNRTNEVMRVLTLFSVFFLPLNFIVGVYGMNFEHMPEIKWRYGYLGVWALLLGVFLALYTWFARRGWIRWGHLS